jgi:ParB family chromosome partitioning protein
MLDLTALDRLRVSSLLDEPQGRPLDLSLDAIDFDPSQPRRHLDDSSLAELAQTIRQCGVIQPISVHPKAGVPGRYVVNVGERRVRASRLAGLQTVPAFVEAPMNAYARVIENLAREDLSPFDLATFIVEREQAGDSRKSIAASLGKPPSFVTELAALAGAPEAVRRIHASGRCSDVRVLYRLSRLDQVNPGALGALSEDSLPVTRERLDMLERGGASSEPSTPHDESAPTRVRRKRVNALLVEVAGRMAFLPLKIPDSMGIAQVVYEDGSREQVELGRLRLIQWTSL